MENVSKKEFDDILSQNFIIFSENYMFENHMLWYGYKNDDSSNKKNLLRYFVAKINNQDYLKMEKHIFPISNNHDTFNITIYKSIFHWELDFAWTGNNTNNLTNKNSNDQYVIDYFVNNFCKTFNMNVDKFKILVLFNTHRLTLNNQKMILRVMENTFENVKFIIITEALNKIDYTIKSRCINIRIPLEIYNKKINNEYIYSVYLDKKTQFFHFIKIKNSENISSETIYNVEIESLNINTWNGNSIKNTLEKIFNDIVNLKCSINTQNHDIFKSNYNKIILDIDNYLLACNSIQEFVLEFINFLIQYNNEKIFKKTNLCNYINFFAKMEAKSHKCDYQIYILESIITYFLMN